MREVTVKIGLERINTQKGMFAKKQGFKLKKLERPINVRNMNGLFNKKGPIENTVEVNIYYQGHREKTEIGVIGGQKWTVILGMP